MPRKFLGERIEPTVDAIRPASMTLTAEDLEHIPIFHVEEENTTHIDEDVFINNNSKRGKRLSRKFGGTLRLKQRLESVPEIFLYDFKKKSQTKKTLQGQEKGSNNIPPIPNRLSKGRVSSERRPRDLQDRRVLQKRISSKTLPTLPKLLEEKDTSQQPLKINKGGSTESFVEPVLVDIGKSDSEILFDEIVACYGLNNNTLGTSNTNAFNQELERVLNHVTKIDNINKMHREFLPKELSHLSPPTTKKLIPTTPTLNSIDAQLATPIYSDANQSSPWSSLGDEYSVTSSHPSTTADTTSSYSTARENIDSINELSITKIPTNISEDSTKGLKTIIPALPNLPPSKYYDKLPARRTINQIKPSILKKIELIPRIANVQYPEEDEDDVEVENKDLRVDATINGDDDSDDYVISPLTEEKSRLKLHPRVHTIRALSEKIDNLRLGKQNTILSASSSVYSVR